MAAACLQAELLNREEETLQMVVEKSPTGGFYDKTKMERHFLIV